LRSIEEMLRRSGEVHFFSGYLTEDGLRPLAELAIPISEAGKVPLSCFLAPSEEPQNVVIEKLSPVKTIVDIDRSNLLEIWRPFYDGKVIRRGRFYYQDRFFEAGALAPKDPEFCKWADRVLSRVKRTLRYDKTLGAYFGADAEIAIASGRVSHASAMTETTKINYRPLPTEG
jgi:hypothetical protein